MTDTITIPLSKLTPWTGNVRRTGAADGIADLAASIAAHGLLQSLVVRKGKRGKYEIVAGQRRYLALCALAKDCAIDTDYAVPCMLADNASDATELSLAENVIRAPMHPADQFEAYRTLIDDGATVADIAARFGLSELAVSQRLKLGRLSPTILEAYRQGEIGLDHAQAFTVTDDHEAQDRVLSQLSPWNREPCTIRRALIADEIPTSDKRVRFIGTEAYLSAGGAIRQDLFSDEDEGYLLDSALLDRLVSEKLATIAAPLSAEGWRWVETAADVDYQALSRFARRYPDRTELSDDDQSELDRLSEEYDALVDSDDESDAEQLAAIEQRIDELNAKTETWPSETLTIAGAIVTLNHNGSPRIERGLVRKEDLPKANHPGEAPDSSEEDSASTDTALSPRLIEDLTAEKSAVIAAELMGQPDIALAAVVHALALDHLYPGHSNDSCLRLRLSPPGLRAAIAKPDMSKALAAIDTERDRIGDWLPGNPDDLWVWCLERSRDELLGLLSFLAASGVDAVQRKADRPDASRLIHGNHLAQALKLDMTAWYVPTAEGYFGRVRRAQILAAIDEAKGAHAPALEKLKKSDLATRAEALIANTGWLPAPIRIAPSTGADGDAGITAEAAE